MDIATLEDEGWFRLPTIAFSSAIGPTFISGDPGRRVVGLICDPAHANENIGIVHGGVFKVLDSSKLEAMKSGA